MDTVVRMCGIGCSVHCAVGEGTTKATAVCEDPLPQTSVMRLLRAMNAGFHWSQEVKLTLITAIMWRGVCVLIMWRLLLLSVRQGQYRQGISKACLNNIVVNIVEAHSLSSYIHWLF